VSKTHPITSASNPRIKRLLKLRKHRQRRASGVFLAEGLREIERAAAAGLILEELYLCPELLGDQTVAAEAGAQFEIPAVLLKKAAYRDDPQGVLAVVQQPVWTLADVPTDALLLIAVGTEKPGNLGAMVRTAAAAGCGAVLATGPVDAFNPNAIRASTGAVFALPVIEADEDAILSHCKAAGIRLLATTPEAGKPYDTADYSGGVGVVIGPEDRGLDAHWLAATDERVTIPMAEPNDHNLADSLNASAAAAILLFEAKRHRRAVGQSEIF